jgi:pyridoxal phosphate enzyme (YggS family)
LTVQEKVEGVRGRITAAAVHAGREPGSVTLMAAVKTRTPDEIRSVLDAGVTFLGENRVQEGQEHQADLPGELRTRYRYHFIGRLQANKARKALLLFDSIDSVDSEELASRLQRIAAEEGITREVMVEVNLGEESQKGGVAPGEAAALAEFLRSCPNLRLTGIMGVPPLDNEPEESRPYFQKLRLLFATLERRFKDPAFRYCSMGMTQDLEVAVEEGSTLVRVGTALFGERK